MQTPTQGYHMKQVFLITYPTGKIYVGKDSVGSFRYFGSPSIEVVNEDMKKLPKETQMDYTVRKTILWESSSATEEELSRQEVHFIRHYRSNEPSIGYNRWPRPLGTSR